jgi:uncharacterized protein
MKTPCELIVWYVLPMIRKGITDELVDYHHLSQRDVARIFEVNDSTISSYRSKKRGFHQHIQNTKQYQEIKYEFEKGALRIMKGTKVQPVICDICIMIKQSGLLDIIYDEVTGKNSNGKYARSFIICQIS